MNKKLIAIKVSKHPLIKRLSEVVDKKTMARLIVEAVLDQTATEQVMDDFADQFQSLDNILKSASFNKKAKEIFETAFDALENDYLEYSGKGEYELPKEALEDILKNIEEYQQKYNQTFGDEEETQLAQQKPQQQQTTDGPSDFEKLKQAIENVNSIDGLDKVIDSGLISKVGDDFIAGLIPRDQWDALQKLWLDKVKEVVPDEEQDTKETDTDDDGIVDDTEKEIGTNPEKPDTDGDGLEDGVEDANQDGNLDSGETDPNNPDTDGDGTNDGDESRPKTEENPYKKLPGYEKLTFEEGEEEIFLTFLKELSGSLLLEAKPLRGISDDKEVRQKIADIIKSFDDEEQRKLIQILYKDEVQEFLKNNLKKIDIIDSTALEDDEAASKTDGEDTTGTTVPTDTSDLDQPDYFDLTPDQKEDLFKSAKEFINEFYEQQYLYEQGVLTKNMLSAILRIKSGEEKEKAAKRSGGEVQRLPEAQEDKVEASKGRLRSIQIAFRTFLREIKATKKAMEDFAEVAESGSIVASSKKRKFIKLLQRQQRDIVSLHNGLSMIMKNTLDEDEDKDMSTEVKWGNIEKHYDLASEALRGLIALSNKEQSKLRNAVKLMDDAISNLRELSGYFPNVNPFGRKDDNYDQFGQEYTDAVEEIKSLALQPILELTRTGEASKNVIQTAMEALKQFATQISTIFGVKSQFKDAPPPSDKDEEAAQASEEKTPIEDDFMKRTKAGALAATAFTRFKGAVIGALGAKVDPTDDEIKILFKFYRFMRNRKRRTNESIQDELTKMGYIQEDIQEFIKDLPDEEFDAFKEVIQRMIDNNLIDKLPELIFPVPDQTMDDFVMGIHDEMQTKNIDQNVEKIEDKIDQKLGSDKPDSLVDKILDYFIGKFDVDIDSDDLKMGGEDFIIPKKDEDKLLAKITASLDSEGTDAASFWTKPLENQVSYILKLDNIPDEYKVKYFKAKPPKDYSEEWEKLLGSIKQGKSKIGNVEELKTWMSEYNVKDDIFKTYSDEPLEAADKEKIALLAYAYLFSTFSDKINEEYYQKIPSEYKPDEEQYRRVLKKLSDVEKTKLKDFHTREDPKKLRKLYKILKDSFGTKKMNFYKIPDSTEFISLFLNSDEQMELYKAGFEGDELEEQIANKLKPLIREMLRRN